MILIKNGKVITMEGDVYKKGNVLIKGDKIVKVSENKIEVKDVEIIDAADKYVLPGFIDSHCHLGMWEDSIGFEGADGNETSNPVTPELRAIDGINPLDRYFSDAYQGGVTCVATGPGSTNVVGGQYACIKTYGDSVDEMVVKAPLAMKCAFGENPKNTYSNLKKSPVTRMAIASTLREILMKAKKYNEKKVRSLDGQLPEPEYDIRLEALIPVLNKEIPLKAHVHRADDILTAIRIAKEFDVRITLDHCTEGHLIHHHIKNSGYDVIVGPSFGDRPKFELKNKSFITAGVLSNKGIRTAIATDHPVVPIQNLSMCAALCVKAGMNKDEALKAITINAARILEIDDKVGSIKEGKDADIIILDGHPFDIQTSVNYTIINGKIVYKNIG